ncbi:MAG: hypothetical protein QGI32_22810, partial [Candidatus Latescibacteria bacterium]|nr:hypothetical protein [Candidatus Latescibacterota bacterium]
SHQSLHLGVGDHLTSRDYKGLDRISPTPLSGKYDCRQPGEIIVANHRRQLFVKQQVGAPKITVDQLRPGIDGTEK